MKKLSYTTLTCLIISGLMLFCTSGSVFAKTATLTFAHPYPSVHLQHVGVLVPWAQKIESQSKGAIKIKFVPGGALGKPGQAYDMVTKGVADIGWDICDYSPGKFPLTTVVELPFMVETAEQASVALWKTYEKFPEFQAEYSDTKLLMLSGHAPGFFATVKKPVTKLADLKGMKIKTASSFTTDALTLFGAVPVVQPVTETYTSLKLGVVDGVVSPFDGIAIFKLHEILQHYTPANFYSLVFWIAMNKKKFNSLPDDLKQVIEENSGLALSRIHGKSFDETYASMKTVCEEKGMKPVQFENGEMEKLISMTAPLKEKWVKDIEAKGLPGKAVLETITAELAQ